MSPTTAARTRSGNRRRRRPRPRSPASPATPTRFYSIATDPLGLVQPTPTAAQATTTVNNSPPPTPPTIIGEQALFTRKLNKKHKPVGKPVLAGFSIDYSAAMNPATAGNAANYQLDWISTKHVKRKTVQVLHPVPIRVVYDAVDQSVSLLLKRKAGLRAGRPDHRHLDSAGRGQQRRGRAAGRQRRRPAGDNGTFTILPRARGISHS